MPEGRDDATRRDATEPASVVGASRPATTPSAADGDGTFRVGPYRVLRELGRGGMGVVYLAEDPELRRRVALKVLPAELARSPEALARFHREAETASRLDDPRLCGVLAFGTAEGRPWLAMKLVAGETLAERIRDVREGRGAHVVPPAPGVPPLDAALRFVEAIARALHGAHEAGVLHRDVKPGNVMVTPEGAPVLLDFGLARDDSAAGGPALTEPGAVMGTPHYMAPEILREGGGSVDRRADVYALGVSLYEVLALRRPFEAATRQGLFRAILSAEAPRLRALRPDAPRDLEIVVLTAIERDPSRRYATALALAEDLAAVRELRPIRARPTPLHVRVAKWARRRPAAAAALVALLVALPLGGMLVARATLLGAELDAAVARRVSDGDAALRSGRTAAARREFDAARALRPDAAGLEARLAAVAFREALDRAEASVADGDDAEVAEARAAIVALRATAPDDAAAAVLESLASLRLGRVDDAKIGLERFHASHDAPEVGFLLRLLGSTADGLPDLPADARDLPAAAKLVAARLRLAQGKPAEALELFERLLAEDADGSAAAWRAAVAAARAGDPETAVAHALHYRTYAGALTPEQDVALAAFLRAAGRGDQAVRIAEGAAARLADPGAGPPRGRLQRDRLRAAAGEAQRPAPRAGRGDPPPRRPFPASRPADAPPRPRR